MAALEHEAAAPFSLHFSVRLDLPQQEKLARAAQVSGQTLDEFAASALLGAADEALASPARLPLPQTGDPLDRIAGIFRNEPSMEELMGRIREDRRVEIAAIEAEIEAEARKEEALG